LNNLFSQHIAEAQGHRVLFEHCTGTLNLPGDFTDILRMEVVYSLSAFDKLIHDIIAYGCIEIFGGRRAATNKYQAEKISLSQAAFFQHSDEFDCEREFERIIKNKLSVMCFMDPDKLTDGLSLVWTEEHKWQAVSQHMAEDQKSLRVRLRNIYRRRNSIVHESDYDHAGQTKYPISPVDSKAISDFIRDLGLVIYSLVI
jgi:hypothetical protein